MDFLQRRVSRRPLAAVAAGVMMLSVFPIPASAAPASFAQSAPGLAQIERRLLPTKPLHVAIPQNYSRERVDLKLKENTAIRLRGGTLASVGTDDVRALQAVLQRYPGVRVDRLFSRPEADLAQEKARIEQKSSREQADKNLYYRLALPPAANTESLIDELNALDIVEIAYAEPNPAPPPATPSFVDAEGFRDVGTSGGIDADFANNEPGGDGRHVKIFDIEYSWNTQHEDLGKLRVPGAILKNKTPNDPFSSTNHGTAVIGELVGDNNGIGIEGIVPGAQLAVVNASNVEDGSDIADSIDLAAASAAPGDVIIIEQQTVGPNGGCTSTTQMGCAPVEWVQAIYDAIVAATSDGVIVVEPAANGSQNLDSSAYGTSFPNGRADSGAIIVGAGAAPGCTKPTRGRLGFSNYGTRVDVQGWGECVVTAGYGDYQGGSNPNAWYTSAFSGTSSATPIVAGAAAAISSVAQELTGVPLTPRRVRSILKSTGSAQDTTTTGAMTGNIGPLPNIRAALNSVFDEIRFELAGVPDGRLVWGVDDTTGRRTLLQREWDGIYRGVELVNLSSLSSVSYHYEVGVGVDPVRVIRTVDQFSRTVAAADRDAGFVDLFTTAAASATAFNPPAVAYLNQRQTWNATFTDTFGGGIVTPRLELTATGGTKNFSIGTISYDVPSNKVCLFNTDGTSSCALHSAGGTLQNADVRVDVAGTTTSVTGKSITTTWAFTLLDDAGNQRFSANSSISDIIGLQATRSDTLGVTHQPRAVGITPNSGFVQVNAPTGVTGTYSDPDGAADLSSVSAALTNGVTLSYSAAQNRLYVSDEPLSLTAGCAPGEQRSIRTATVSLNCAASTVRQADASTLQVTWQAAFLGSLSGKQYVEAVQARDDLGGDSGPVNAGQLAIDSAPVLSGLTPTSGSQAFGTAQAFTATVSDPDAISELDTVDLRLDSPVISVFGKNNDLVIRYYAASNKFGLFGDDGKTLSTCAAGEAKVLSNSLASLDCAASKALFRTLLTGQRDALVTWVVTPSKAMSGVTYQSELRATDTFGATAGPQSFGTWRVN